MCEQLLYGPKQKQSQTEWCKLFKLKGDDNDSDNDDDEYDYDYDLLYDFLEANNFVELYSNTFLMLGGWQPALESQIGIRIKDSNNVSKLEMENVKSLCIKYKLDEPTFYTGLEANLNVEDAHYETDYETDNESDMNDSSDMNDFDFESHSNHNNYESNNDINDGDLQQ